ncbi:MAG: MoaD/ThiS family protein [Thermoprotei archaeon]|jgi:MoaD family protein
MVNVKVKLYSIIAQRVKGSTVINIDANQVKDVINKLIDLYGATLKDLILDENQQIKSTIGIFVNGKNIQTLNGIETKLNENDEIYILPIVAGG